MKPSITLLLLPLFLILAWSPVRGEVDCYHDYVSPVAICDAHTVVALSNTGTAKLWATDIDDGSYDNCYIAEYLARRMSPGWCPPGVADDTQFRPYVEFCCEDVGQTIWVVLRVVDGHGNYNECMAEVTVQDNTSPNLICPPNITVSCSFWFSPDALNNPYNRTFGTIATNGAPRLPIIINDPGNTWDPQPKNWGIDGTAGSGVCGSGNVWVTIPEVIDYRNSCGVGIIKRKFYIEMGYWSDWCYQTITVKDYSYGGFNINWPEDYHADGCMSSPEDVEPGNLPPPYNKPTINGYGGYGNSCSLIGYAHDDLVFTFSEGACYKILRDWTVIDWCKYQPNNPWSPGIWHHTQVIKLFNHNPPVFVDGCHDIEVPGYEPNCSGRYYEKPHVVDDCSPVDQLVWDYKIDLWMDGSYDISYAGEGQPTVDRVIPNGWHRILWNVADGCGNYATCSYKVHVVDKKAPTPVCLYGLSSVVMPVGGMVTIWAKDFNASSYDNCTPQYKLKYSFSENPNEASHTFTCDDLGTNPVHIWVHDEYGNKDYCTTYIIINDNEDACQGMNLVAGLVTTFSGTPVPNTSAAMYKIMPDQSLDEDESKGMSNTFGQFNLGFGTTQYDRMIMLNRQGKPLEGMSTLDFIALKRHISGEELITEPYKLYAADLDGNGHIGANDLLLMKQALLGGYKLPGYAGNLKWIFFGDPCDPTTPEDLFNAYCHPGVEVNHSGSFPAHVKFKAVKMGDVNGDMTNMAWDVQQRSAESFPLVVRDRADGLGVDFIMDRESDVYGFQMNIKGTNLEVSSDVISIDESNLAADEDSYSRLSWGQEVAAHVRPGDVLFTLWNLPVGINPVDLLEDNEDGLKAEIYTQDLEGQPISLRQAEVGSLRGPFETRVNPNPFTDNTTLQVTLPAGEDFWVSIYNMKGEELFRRHYLAGSARTDVGIGPETINIAGMYYYKVSSKLGDLSGKFIRQ